MRVLIETDVELYPQTTLRFGPEEIAFPAVPHGWESKAGVEVPDETAQRWRAARDTWRDVQAEAEAFTEDAGLLVGIEQAWWAGPPGDWPEGAAWPPEPGRAAGPAGRVRHGAIRRGLSLALGRRAVETGSGLLGGRGPRGTGGPVGGAGTDGS